MYLGQFTRFEGIGSNLDLVSSKFLDDQTLDERKLRDGLSGIGSISLTTGDGEDGASAELDSKFHPLEEERSQRDDEEGERDQVPLLPTTYEIDGDLAAIEASSE